MTETRTLRADAARNRRELLRAAADEFRERGPDASIESIARRAGIGKGTVFRHFASKDHLMAAIVTDRLEDLGGLAESLAGAPDAGAALADFLAASAERQQEQSMAFLAAADPAVLREAGVEEVRERMFQAVYALVDRARGQGAIRADVTGPDVVLLMCAPTHVAEPLAKASPDLWRRYLAIILDGLRPDGARNLPHPAPPAPLP
ncbi:TetR/AcrR family transcriptional regulator [Hamadaea tsunoensis]|uniref:TetR/AcrR family transcriptional regulator n=1 Tax=Hamadaea tsunoensis TaxID=53368 RepID=UPI000422F03C|nr:TetR/AcrR family transcriptional regulator [Hamadaea tsunoensis]